MQVRTCTSAGMQEPVVPDCADLEMIPQLVTDNRHCWERESPSVLAFNLLNLVFLLEVRLFFISLTPDP